MNHWLLDSIEAKRVQALKEADRIQFYQEMGCGVSDANEVLLRETAAVLEIAVLDLQIDRLAEKLEQLTLLRKASADAFRLLRVLSLPEDPMERATHLLRASLLAVLGDRSADAARWLRILETEGQWPDLPLKSQNWGERCRATLSDVWLRLIRKKGWDDRDAVLEHIAALREAQDEFEREYLHSFKPIEAKRNALELIAIYHLAKAADVLAHYITDGVVDGNHQVKFILDSHFDRAIEACEAARLIEMESFVRLLSYASSQMVDNALWTVTRKVNSRVTQFVRELVSRGRGDRALFDVLPPQRRALAERGLLGSSRQAVVVSLPTSSGKTLIAQFRILQALNQFEDQKGWVAYLAPTRALVNQIFRQLRRDFEPLGLVVERVSPAMEIDSIEAKVLQESREKAQFRVLIATPEKFDLMIRQGWEEKIGRPLSLVVVDEAHNIQETSRGLRLELLLATINRECQNAQFLLLTPFINNAGEVARWLGGQSSDDISIGVDWQPNDRAIGIVVPQDNGPLNDRSRDYQLAFETVHTTRPSIVLDENFNLGKDEELAPTLFKAKDTGTLAAIATRKFKERGPVIAMHSRPDYVWKLAEKIKSNHSQKTTSKDVAFVQEYIASELGEGFPLIDLLSHGIGVHHGGLPEEIRMLMEWLFEKGELEVLAATTTIAQGVNFPVSGVVMAATQYPYGQDMPPEDFWNIAGRAGRVSQGQLGIIALVAKDQEEVEKRRAFINQQTGDLNSALIKLAQAAGEELADLGQIVYNYPEWSSFLQYLVHTYQQMGAPENYADQIEQVLRGTLGFEKLRASDSRIARRLLDGVRSYVNYISKPQQPLKLVDSTGFSLQSIRTVMANRGNIGPDSWDKDRLFKHEDKTLQEMMGILLRVPELKDNLDAVLGNGKRDGEKLAKILKDWVNGEELPVIAERYFKNNNDDMVKALTKCGQNLFGKLTQTSSWGLSALLAITASGISEEERAKLANLPSQVFYGVANDEAIALRLLGVPRKAAMHLSNTLNPSPDESLSGIRQRLRTLPKEEWQKAMGPIGGVYHRVWRVLEGNED